MIPGGLKMLAGMKSAVHHHQTFPGDKERLDSPVVSAILASGSQNGRPFLYCLCQSAFFYRQVAVQYAFLGKNPNNARNASRRGNDKSGRLEYF